MSPTGASPQNAPNFHAMLPTKPVTKNTLMTLLHLGVRSSKWPKSMLPTAKIMAVIAIVIHMDVTVTPRSDNRQTVQGEGSTPSHRLGCDEAIFPSRSVDPKWCLSRAELVKRLR